VLHRLDRLLVEGRAVVGKKAGVACLGIMDREREEPIRLRLALRVARASEAGDEHARA
jgi:hypothetical protein